MRRDREEALDTETTKERHIGKIPRIGTKTITHERHIGETLSRRTEGSLCGDTLKSHRKEKGDPH